MYYLLAIKMPVMFYVHYISFSMFQSINASHNHIKTVAVFPILPRVLSLSLQHNSIRRIDKMAFSGLENLQNLDLSYNMITGMKLPL